MRKKRWKLVAAFLAVAAVIAAACYTVFFAPDGTEEQYIYKEETVAFGNLTQGITESGSVEFLTTDQNYDLDLDLDDDSDDDEESEEDSSYLRIEEVYVSAGERVEEGEAVFKLTARSVESVRRKLQSARSEAQVALTEAESTYETTALTAKQTYDSSILTGEKAEEEYQVSTTTLNGNIIEAYTKINVLQNEIDELQKELEDEEKWEDYDDLREAYEDAKEDYEKCDPKRLATYAKRRDTYLQAKEAYETARDERLEKSDSIQDKTREIGDWYLKALRLQQKLERQSLDARQNYENAVQEGELAQEIYNESVEALQEEVDSARADLEEAQKQLNEFEAFVADGIVYAKGSGLVTAVNYEAGDSLTKQGAMFSYVKSGDYVISIDISEEDIPYIEVGKEVNIVFTAYPDETYQGTVKEIAASSSSDHATTISYPVTIHIEGDTTRLYGGMTGDVTFVTDEAEQVVYVSRKAIVEQNGKSCVYIQKADGTMELKQVKTGFTDGISVQITEGLQEGDTIYIASKVSGTQSKEELQEEQPKEERPNEGQPNEEQSKEGLSNEAGELPQTDERADREESGHQKGGMP